MSLAFGFYRECELFMYICNSELHQNIETRKGNGSNWHFPYHKLVSLRWAREDSTKTGCYSMCKFIHSFIRLPIHSFICSALVLMTI